MRAKKIVIASVFAFIILNIATFMYSFLPVHIPNEENTSDYVWTSNSIWFRCTEGISYGKMDKKGFNNLQVINNPDILVLGSSHMEAMNVYQDENLTYNLGKILENQTVYNRGISGHNFIKVCKYLENNLKTSFPSYTVIETSSVEFSEEQIDSLFNNTVGYTPSHSEGLIGFLQKLPFLRLLYIQIKNGLLDILNPPRISHSNQEVNQDEDSLHVISQESYDRLFSYLDEIQKKYDSQLIIFYHPTATLNSNGSVSFISDKHALEVFSKACSENEIIFLDMTEPFERMYYEDHYVPHGFITGPSHTGHLNKYGHYAIAQELAKVISVLEEEK